MIYKIDILNNRKIYIFEDHNYSVYYWNEISQNCGLYPLNVIQLDFHHDLNDWKITINDEEFTEIEQLLKIRYNDEKMLKAISNLDKGAFNKPAFRFGIIKDLFHFSSGNDTNDDEIYNFNGINHEVKLYRYFDILFGDGGKLFDEFNPEHEMFMNLIDSNNFLVDIDLDYFTYEYKGCAKLNSGNYPFSNLNFENLKQFYLKDKNRKILSRIINNCVGFTIALESKFCGGKENSLLILKKILNFLNNFLDFEFDIDLIRNVVYNI